MIWYSLYIPLKGYFNAHVFWYIKTGFLINKLIMLFIFFLPTVFGECRGPRPDNLETTIAPIDYHYDYITDLIWNITERLLDHENETEIFYNTLNYNCKIHEDQMFQVLSTIVSPVKEIHHTLQRSEDCTKILKQYGIIFLCLSVIIGTLNIVGMFSVILAWKKSARYKFPENSIPVKKAPAEESVTLICKKETRV